LNFIVRKAILTWELLYSKCYSSGASAQENAAKAFCRLCEKSDGKNLQNTKKIKVAARKF
jgi:hypothetical protein